MSSSSKNKQQHSKRRERLSEETPFPTPNSAGISPPHPYHESPPPPPPPLTHKPLQQRTTSSDSKMSDISMDDFGGSGALDSAFEYSDTSDDMREDSYFMPRDNPYSPPSLLGNGVPTVNRRPYNPYQRNGGRNNSGLSAFRELRKSGSNLSEVMQFSSQNRSDSFSDSDPFGDNISNNMFYDSQHSSIAEETPAASRQDDQSLSVPKRKGSKASTWMKKVAYAFRSPSMFHDNNRKNAENFEEEKKSSDKVQGGHRRMPSGSTMEYANALVRYPSQPSEITDLHHSMYETSPLLIDSKPQPKYSADPHVQKPADFHPLNAGSKTKEANAMSSVKNRNDRTSTGEPLLTSTIRTESYIFPSRRTAAQVAAFFLMDYEASRPPTHTSDFETITKQQLKVYRIHFSWPWRWFVNLAIVVLFLSHTQNLLVTAVMHTCVIIVFAIEIQMKECVYGCHPKTDTRHTERKLNRPMAAFLILLGMESWLWFFVETKISPEIERPPIFSSVFKPIVFFYVSAKARDSLEALQKISQIVFRVLIIEFVLILTFASVACRMFGSSGHESFRNLSVSWLSLFELSTTVVNPSLWMPVYQENPSNSLFFVAFIVTCTFYYHSLVLSVVFQTYIQAVTEVYERSAADREDAVRLAFLALMKDQESDYISTSSVKKCLQIVRPHYNAPKMKALLEIVDPSNEHVIDYPTFRTKIRAALNASIRTARASTTFAMGVELIAVMVAVTNFMYVLMVTSEWHAAWFDIIQVVLGAVITLLGLLELVIRSNPLRIHGQHFAPLTRLNPFFDGLASIAALVSCAGIIQYAAGYATSIDTGRAVDFLLLGRAIDMIRVMRFFPIFRDVVRRSTDVLPAMAGPLVLMLSVIHIFVFAGILIWGGAIDVEALLEHEELTPLYALNNFNSYTKGLVTMFNIAVVNDWHAIAEVYLYAERNRHPLIVYTFFIGAISTTVFIMLNVITAFFVESFVTKRHDPMEDHLGGEEREVHHREFQIRTGENTNVKRVAGTSLRPDTNLRADLNLDDDDEPSSTSPEGDLSVASNASGELFSFDIYEREGFDQIMRTVAGSSEAEQEAFAQNLCRYYEIYDSLTNGREKVGYMVCCQYSMHRFGNRRFQTLAQGFITDDILHKVVSDMHSEILVLTTRKKSFGSRCLVRTFPHQLDNCKVLEVTATLLRYQPAATLLVARIRVAPTSSLDNIASKR